MRIYSRPEESRVVERVINAGLGRFAAANEVANNLIQKGALPDPSWSGDGEDLRIIGDTLNEFIKDWTVKVRNLREPI
jgi:hypothetical protein